MDTRLKNLTQEISDDDWVWIFPLQEINETPIMFMQSIKNFKPSCLHVVQHILVFEKWTMYVVSQNSLH
jgi:hypothetical protein